jgi:hypothetical protein
MKANQNFSLKRTRPPDAVGHNRVFEQRGAGANGGRNLRGAFTAGTDLKGAADRPGIGRASVGASDQLFERQP